MKNKIRKALLAMSCLMMASIVISKEYEIKPNRACQNVKDDKENIYNLDNISTFDILDALDQIGVRIVKVDLPKTDKERSLAVVVEEYSKGKLVDSNEFWCGSNTYTYWEAGDTLMYKDFIDKMVITTYHKTKDSMISVGVRTNAMSRKIPVKYKQEREDAFYLIRTFKPSEFKYGEKMPMIAIASSWYDERIKMDRFCGASVLSFDEEETKELLMMSPNYYIVSYIIK